MLQVRNKSVQTTPIAIPATATIVPFDTTVVSTNSNLELSKNTILEKVAGIYSAECVVCLAVDSSASAASTVTLTAYSDEGVIAGASVTTTIAAGSSATLILPWTTSVVPAASGTASISWYISGGAVTLTNACATVYRHT